MVRENRPATGPNMVRENGVAKTQTRTRRTAQASNNCSAVTGSGLPQKMLNYDKLDAVGGDKVSVRPSFRRVMRGLHADTASGASCADTKTRSDLPPTLLTSADGGAISCARGA